jgi:hypothetical protein
LRHVAVAEHTVALLTSDWAGMTPDPNLIGLVMAAENIENFLKGTPTHVVVGPGNERC